MKGTPVNAYFESCYSLRKMRNVPATSLKHLSCILAVNGGSQVCMKDSIAKACGRYNA